MFRVFNFDKFPPGKEASAQTIVQCFADLLAKLGIRNREFAQHALTAAQIRLAMMALPDIPDNLSHNGMRKIVARHLTACGLKDDGPFSDTEIEMILDIVTNVKRAQHGLKKTGWAQLHYKRKDELLKSQNGRCRVCGKRLVTGSSADQLASPEVDHIVPFALGGDKAANLRVICKQCNSVKSNNISYINSDVVSLNYFIKKQPEAKPYAVKYWVFERDSSRCTEASCTRTALDGELTVKMTSLHGRYIYDNLRTVCIVCANK